MTKVILKHVKSIVTRNNSRIDLYGTNEAVLQVVFKHLEDISQNIILMADEEASSLSRVSLVFFIGSLAAVSLSRFAPVLIWVFIIGFVLAMILATVVLSTEKIVNQEKLPKQC